MTNLLCHLLFGVLAMGFGVFAPATAQAHWQSDPASDITDFEGKFRFSQMTTAYVHGVFGQKFEFAMLSDAKGQVLYAPDDSVLEDRMIRVLDLNHDGWPEILTIEANAAQGANLVLIALRPDGENDGWKVLRIARGPAIGMGYRWMNPLLGQVDVDADGIDDIAVMITPHIGGPVQVLSWRHKDLVPIRNVSVPGLSNHMYGDLDLATSRFFVDEAGRPAISLRSRADWSKHVVVILQ